VQQQALREGLYLPTGKPHLNHIEGLWNFMRRQLTRTYFFPDFLWTLWFAKKVA
jgi:pterin-4a-carbinolamine dehydratase